MKQAETVVVNKEKYLKMVALMRRLKKARAVGRQAREEVLYGFVAEDCGDGHDVFRFLTKGGYKTHSGDLQSVKKAKLIVYRWGVGPCVKKIVGPWGDEKK